MITPHQWATWTHRWGEFSQSWRILSWPLIPWWVPPCYEHGHHHHPHHHHLHNQPPQVAFLGDHGFQLGEHGEYAKWNNFEISNRFQKSIFQDDDADDEFQTITLQMKHQGATFDCCSWLNWKAYWRPCWARRRLPNGNDDVFIRAIRIQFQSFTAGKQDHWFYSTLKILFPDRGSSWISTSVNLLWVFQVIKYNQF